MTTGRKLNFTSLESRLLYKSFGDDYIVPGTAARGLLQGVLGIATGGFHSESFPCLPLGVAKMTNLSKHYDSILTLGRLTVSQLVPVHQRENFFLPDNSPWGRSLIIDPIYSSKTIRRVIISSRPSHTSRKVRVVHVFISRCRGFMNISWIGIVDVIHGQLNKDFLMRVENEGLKLNGLALIFSP